MVLNLESALTIMLDLLSQFQLKIIALSGYMYRTSEASLQSYRTYLKFSVSPRIYNYHVNNELYIKIHESFISSSSHQSRLKNTLFYMDKSLEVERARRIIDFTEVQFPPTMYPRLSIYAR